MKSHRTIVILIVLVLSVVLCSCSNSTETNVEQIPRVKMATGPSGLTVHTLGSTLSEFIKDTLLISVEPGTPNGNAMSVDSGEAEFSISMTTSVVNGYNGENYYADKEKLENIRVVATLWHHYLLPVTGDLSLKDISQLEGKEFTSGPPGGDAEPLAIQLLSYVGLDESDYTITPYTFTEATEALKNRQIDLMFAGSPMPNSLHEDLGKTMGGRYINIGKDNAQRLVNEYNGLYFMEFDMAPSGIEIDTPYYTASYKAVLIVNKDVSEEIVYEMTKGIYENYESLGNAIGNMKGFPINELMDEVGNVPYHQGAIKYYKEVGLVN